jgi:hypothetical protein
MPQGIISDYEFIFWCRWWWYDFPWSEVDMLCKHLDEDMHPDIVKVFRAGECGDTSSPKAVESVDFFDCKDALKQHSITALVKAVREAFLLDSGASIHLIKRSSLTKAELKRVRNSAMPMTLETVNGSRDSTEEVEVFIPALNSLLTFYVVSGRTPNLISLERLCDEQMFHYKKEPGCPPVLWREYNNLHILC